MGLFKKDNPNYIIVQRKNMFFAVHKASGATHGPSTGFYTKQVCQHWINTQGDK